MTRSVRRGLGVVLGAAILVGAAACGGGGFEGEGSSGGSTGSVRMLVNITPNLTKGYWEELVKPFEQANPGVDVKIEAPTGQGVKDSLPQLLAAGNAPDVVETLMADKTLAPQMLDLTDQAWTKDTPLAQEAALDGKVYTVGVGQQAQSLVFYNKAAFAKAGISAPPKTLDELTAAMGKLKAAGYLPLQTAGDYVTGLQLLQLSDPTIASAHPDWYQKVQRKELTVGKTMLPLLQRYESWIKSGYVDKNALGLDDVNAQTSFLSGKSAMYIMGSWFVRTAEAAKPAFDLGVFPAPTDGGQAHPGPQGVTMAAPYMVLKSTEQRDLSLKLVQFLVTDKTAVQSQLSQDGNFRKGFTDGLSPLGRQVQTILDDAPKHVAQGEGYGANTLPQGFNSEWNKAVQSLYVGKSAQDVATRIDGWMGSKS
ncbi:multiple sugar transport system substrate-binding protein/raffinose/stachyose/melibiose transport system substrate-binding protein [Kribbella orskensis]|uniref:Multiple sugar transport system substrate-binding protein/raffinose/stachyose/melibiose transport system substrate-binding protein n=1 Tax=Kribbella orskensis TaxID=2512216 RepID=A0ABY2BHK2_9ACTN|nr:MULTISPECIES: extracellular solute-binding protein [Kribbella]TCN38295.1 multiple sugar transport system substrate-binding protein/raffinose/stachyose/melibiose transport system substrate-binding protein [Kribbella sp. VKM Ac-2500]TCO20175.1 multiple sugar transport system substrate-binding protein/raffinose/stachyose/melibiose transport system substrate-binding protein [Kribbella orskensis]